MRAFTLAELMVVVALIGVIAGITVVSVSQLLRGVEETAAVQQLRKALERQISISRNEVLATCGTGDAASGVYTIEVLSSGTCAVVASKVVARTEAFVVGPSPSNALWHEGWEFPMTGTNYGAQPGGKLYIEPGGTLSQEHDDYAGSPLGGISIALDPTGDPNQIVYIVLYGPNLFGEIYDGTGQLLGLIGV